MTKPVSIQQRIRILDAQGVSWREIARRLGVSRDTVRKYATMEDCSPKPAVRKGRRSLIDACSGTVDSWLSADRLMPRKQRHTARRVYARLVEEEGFRGSYSPVQRYVRRWREEHRPDGDRYLELDWRGGAMQVDFGEAVDIPEGTIPVFWACGVTPQAIVMNSRPSLAITHAPGKMLVTDIPDRDFLIP